MGLLIGLEHKGCAKVCGKSVVILLDIQNQKILALKMIGNSELSEPISHFLENS